MRQHFSVNMTIPIPEDSVMITKAEYDDLKSQDLLGVYWSMKDLETQINKKNEWIKQHILYKEKFRSILDVEHGGFVYYPTKSGQTWSFHAKKMAAFLDEHFEEIFTK
ncbi:DUF771 domain-containing protein [Salisediminibacterium halotolerans]|uniref:DUF771 domain-containing protein n=1 Tax=Salisediminibacterium halotolerans TaxID=517425 RepID=UPI000EB264BA|nr:DUF771 domain-containing protein [Salisediminibacterium halotolerans]RLJ72185.1 phage pi2 protein 07 [Actinophytocola xinjiangensis]RPE85398.1 phage pi2 protein 07 [Salisediminibacterium halotolerans]TWG33355.1 phage pi2 protein 07 [Salisediminibacterium halotolerans]GEL07117.1 hypothetical protein SHA02_05330 [Salisediminibacterium halotolerans]